MTVFIILVLGIAILLYVLLGGADFGAGIVEIFTGKRGIHTISRAIAPVWEANHIWLILAVVILFNGFPLVYTTLTTYLHIPILILLIGITVRGSAFTFRYYDIKDQTQWYYTLLFRISSIVTPVFLGIVLGSIMMGRISTNPSGDFYENYIYPWLNYFTFATGFFVCLLFAWLASVYLIGEAKNQEEHRFFTFITILLFVLMFIAGAFIFGFAEFYRIYLFKKFQQSPIGLSTVVLATFLIPVFWYSVKIKNIFLTRFLAGGITACIFTGWFAVQFPVMVFTREANNLTLFNTRAPEATMNLLAYALIAGVLIILPAFFYLFRIFKFNNKAKEYNEE